MVAACHSQKITATSATAEMTMSDTMKMRLKPVVALSLVENNLQRAQAQRQQAQADVVDLHSVRACAPLQVRRIADQPRGKQQGDDADRND